MMTAKDYYEERKQASENQLRSVKMQMGWVSFLRLVTMVLLVFFFVRTVKTGGIPWSVFSVIWLVSFIFLVIRHRNLKLQRDRSQALIAINANELNALQGDFSAFEDGTEYLDPGHEFTYDLDIFGKKSLFQFLNRTCTLEGKHQLSLDLLNSPFRIDQIIVRQEIYRELASRPGFMQAFRSEGLLTGDKPGDRNEITEWMEKASFRFSTLLRILMYIIPAVFVILLSLGWIWPVLFRLLLPMILLSFFVNGLVITRVNRYHEKISRKQEILGKYLELNRIISREKFTHPLLKEQARISASSLDMFNRLNRLMNDLDARLNILVGVILNILFMFDLHIIRFLERWRTSAKEGLDGFFMSPAFLDSAISFSTLHFNHPAFCWPDTGGTGLEAVKIGHPLIREESRVINDFIREEGKNIFIITGANMAGKSTFLRTVGVNMVLAGAGAPVCSETFRFEPMAVITGMRTTDSLSDSESYFFAELKRLKRIVDLLSKGDKILILLDEILKGTNSTDKHKGSVALLRKFAGHNCLAFVATHDLALGKMAETFPASVENLHFESFIEGRELRFDYRLRDGLAKNMNASFLMQQMGITG